jgi:tRNA threonylcarbamoyladenosine biosynthesis protein TsaE
MEWTFGLTDIQQVAKNFWATVKGKVFAFHGEMGVGKTTFIHALCDNKKVKDVVSSPTFSLINEYRFIDNGEEKKIFHIDLYRIISEEEARQAGIEDCLYSGQICLVEWPDRAATIFPDETIHVHMEVVDGQRRKIRIINN